MDWVSSVLPLLNDITPYWLTIWIILFQQWTISKRDKRIDVLVEVNHTHNTILSDLTNEINKLQSKK